MATSELQSKRVSPQPNNAKTGKTRSLFNQYNYKNGESVAVRPKIRDDGTMGLQYMPDEMMCRILGINKLPSGYEVGFLDGDPVNNTRANLVLQRIGEGRNARVPAANAVDSVSEILECFQKDFHKSCHIIMTENERAELLRIANEISHRYSPQLFVSQWIRLIGALLVATYTPVKGMPGVRSRSGRPGLSTPTA